MLSRFYLSLHWFLVGDEQVPELLSTHSMLAEFLPDPYVARRPLDQKTYGQAPYELVQFLTDVSNRMLIADKDTHLTFRTYRSVQYALVFLIT